MITRALSSATAGLAVTTGLFYVMQLLVATGEDILTEPRPRYFLAWVSPPDPPDSPVKKTPPKRPDHPKLPPQTHPVDSPIDGSVGIWMPSPPPVPPVDGPILTGFNASDGPLINIIKVRPQYPASAANRELEGTVMVQYDVTTMGTVENVIVVESTNSIFNKAAISAAYRFKYKPRVVDGIPYGAKGLRQLFRFEMEK
jgi:protein TonB